MQPIPSDTKMKQPSIPLPPPTVEVAAGLIFRGGKLLITQRPAGTHLAGLWEFPGGKREPSETFEACLVRELREELGVEVQVGALVESLTHSYPDKTVHLRFFRCTLTSGEPQPLDCAAVKWVPPDDLSGNAFPAADERLLSRLQTTPELWR
jgi:mutator protein MutT